MPVERISKGFKDISSSFKVNPLTNDIIAIKNETAISRSIRNLVHTQKGEKFFRIEEEKETATCELTAAENFLNSI